VSVAAVRVEKKIPAGAGAHRARFEALNCKHQMAASPQCHTGGGNHFFNCAKYTNVSADTIKSYLPDWETRLFRQFATTALHICRALVLFQSLRREIDAGQAPGIRGEFERRTTPFRTRVQHVQLPIRREPPRHLRRDQLRGSVLNHLHVLVKSGREAVEVGADVIVRSARGSKPDTIGRPPDGPRPDGRVELVPVS